VTARWALALFGTDVGEFHHRDPLRLFGRDEVGKGRRCAGLALGAEILELGLQIRRGQTGMSASPPESGLWRFRDVPKADIELLSPHQLLRIATNASSI
jgi:hypothetical protein